MRSWQRIPGAVARRAARIFVHPPAPPAQLEMLWPEHRLADLPVVNVPAGFLLRTYTPADEAQYFALLERAQMGRCPLDYWLQHVLPGGFFVIEEQSSGRLVATCLASHHPAARHPFGGNLGWLAADPDYSGRGLGFAASAAVVERLVSAGYRRIYLTTDDFRLAAISVYLKMGWVPFLYLPEMPERWRQVCGQLGWPYVPGDWVSLPGVVFPV
jgi:mycothiol synthase